MCHTSANVIKITEPSYTGSERLSRHPVPRLVPCLTSGHPEECLLSRHPEARSLKVRRHCFVSAIRVSGDKVRTKDDFFAPHPDFWGDFPDELILHAPWTFFAQNSTEVYCKRGVLHGIGHFIQGIRLLSGPSGSKKAEIVTYGVNYWHFCPFWSTVRQ